MKANRAVDVKFIVTLKPLLVVTWKFKKKCKVLISHFKMLSVWNHTNTAVQ